LGDEFDFSLLETSRGAVGVNGNWDPKMTAADFLSRQDVKEELRILSRGKPINFTTTPKLFKFHNIHYGSLNVTNRDCEGQFSILKAYKYDHPASKLLLISDHLHKKFCNTRPPQKEVNEIVTYVRASKMKPPLLLPPDKTLSCRTLSITDEELHRLIERCNNDEPVDEPVQTEEERLKKKTHLRRILNVGQDKSRSVFTQMQQLIEASEEEIHSGLNKENYETR